MQGEPELMQQLFGVPRMTDVLRSHFGTEPSPDAVSPAAGAILLISQPRVCGWVRVGLQATTSSLRE